MLVLMCKIGLLLFMLEIFPSSGAFGGSTVDTHTSVMSPIVDV
jgi:hypothetical protein